MNAHRHGSLGSDDCTYKGLYAGSQASLSDMASKQAGALNRVARLRSAVIGALKQNFPVEFGAAEAQLGKRMSMVDDEILLAYLNGLLTTARRPAERPVERPPVGMGELAEELRALGVAVPAGPDLRGWATAVATWSQQQAAGAATVAGPDADQPKVDGGSATAGSTTSAQGSSRKRTGSKALRQPAGTAAFVTAAPEPARPGDDDNRNLDELPPGDDPGDGDIPWGEDPGPGVFEDFTGVFDDFPPAYSDPAGAPAEPAGGELPSGGLEDLFGDDLTQLFDDELSDDAEALVDALFTSSDPSSAHRDTDAPGEPAITPEPEPAPAPPTDAASDAAPTADRPEAAATAEKKTRNAGRAGSALRPELFPPAQMPKQAKAPRRGKASRVSAARPDPRGLDVPITQGAGAGDLTDELFNQLVASVCIPRPVFTSDLVAQTGSAELVQAWEQRCHDMGTSSPVRFINPKPRHRQRGALVVPHSQQLRQATAEFAKSWWATCLDERRLRGARLYEVAVLLHRFGESVISSRIEDDVVVLRVTQPRGLVGIAVALETDFTAGSSTRAALADAVGQLLADRLTLVAVLTHTAGDTIERMSTALREESQLRGWAPTTPVVASLSWDFANDGGSSALSVF